MFSRDDEKDAARKLVQQQARAKRDASEAVDDIKENVVGLVQHAKDVGTDKAHQVADYVQGRADNLRLSGREALARAEDRIRSKPGQSVGIAFAAGILASFLLSRRS
jgi:ElaB/YqjD/DUF883 family membrane-anchored ribosome-binding protein